MNNKYLKTIALIISVLSFSCSEKIIEPDDNVGLENFPNQIGTYWLYAVTDSSDVNNVNVDTLEVTIVNSIEINSGENATVWVYEHCGSVDTQYVSIKNDTILFYYQSVTPFITKSFIFPFEVGNGWGNSNDTTTVIEQTSITTPAGEFANSYKITRQVIGFNYSLSSDTWFVNKIGIVAIEKHGINLGLFTDSRRELLDYDIR